MWSGDFAAAFFITFIATVFVPDSAVAAQLSLPRMPTGAPQCWFLKKYFDITAHPEAKWPSQQNTLFFCFLYFTTF